MIKGVNRKVIEINRPDSDYFERAVLYLRPEVGEVPQYAPQLALSEYLRDEERKPRRSMRIPAAFFLGAAVSGVISAVLILIPYASFGG